MQRLGQLIFCLTLLIAALFGIAPSMGTSLKALDLSVITSSGSTVAFNTAHVVPLALMLIFATLILLSTPRDSQNH
jgi:hypothetical protein